MQPSRAIVHVDLDAYFASVEQLDDPSLVGVPVIVGGIGARSVVSAASYEARAFGVRAAMPMSEARRRCPSAVVRSVRMDRYQGLSRMFLEVLRSFSPSVEPMSLDEAFVDLTGTERIFGAPAQTIVGIVSRVREVTGLHCSIGLATSKFVAKIASDLRKPRGVVAVEGDEVEQFLAPLEVARIWGVGPVANARFRQYGYALMRDLQNASEFAVRRDLGDEGVRAKRLAHGIDSREIEPEQLPKSIGQEETFERDTLDLERLRNVLLSQCEAVSIRLRKQGLAAKTVTVKLRYGDFQTATRSHSLAVASDAGSELWATAKELFEAWASNEARPLRLLGVSISGLEVRQDSAGLFPDEAAERLRRLDRAADEVRARFGQDALSRVAAVRRDGA